ncbi:hypothetical protein ACQKP8_06150 [Photobacterium alginatilyticum]
MDDNDFPVGQYSVALKEVAAALGNEVWNIIDFPILLLFQNLSEVNVVE